MKEIERILSSASQLARWADRVSRPPQAAHALRAYLTSTLPRSRRSFGLWLAGSAFIYLVWGAIYGFALHGNLAERELQDPRIILCLALVAWMVVYRQLTKASGPRPEHHVENLDLLTALSGESTDKELTRRYGHEAVLVMEEAAQQLLECRRLLAEPCWTSEQATLARREAAGQTSRAAETTMQRVIAESISADNVSSAHKSMLQLRELTEQLARSTKSNLGPGASAEEPRGTIESALTSLQDIEKAEHELDDKLKNRLGQGK